MSTLSDVALLGGVLLIIGLLLAINIMAAKYISHHLNISAVVAFVILWIFPPAGFLLLLVAFFKPSHVHHPTHLHPY